MWILTLVLFVTLCAGAESFWRSQGHRPSVVDDPDWWAYHRGKIYDRGAKTVVLLGASRIQLGFSTETFRKRFPDYQIVQLSIDGHPAREILRDLASDPQFNGIVICAVEHRGVVLDGPVNEHLDAYRNAVSIDRRTNRQIATWLQSHLVFVNPQVRTSKCASDWLLRGRLPKPNYVTTHSDRSRSADYLATDTAWHRRTRIRKVLEDAKPWKPEYRQAWPANVADTETLVEEIQSRGGQAVFVMFPHTDVSLNIPEQHYPKAKFWDEFAKTTKGVPIHFLDVPTLRDFDCPDTSHLDYRDKPRFTNALIDELVKRGVLPEASDKK